MNKKVKIIMAVVVFCGTSGSLYAESFDEEKYWTIDPASIIIEEVSPLHSPLHFGSVKAAPVVLPRPDVPSLPDVSPTPNIPSGQWGQGINSGDNIFVIIDKIINLGEKIFSIIEKNKPVVDIKVTYANAIPYGITHWTQLAGWQKPKTKAYVFSIKNKFGAEVVKVKYQVHWTHGGAYKSKGKFLTGVTVEPISVTAAWGYTVNLTAEVPDSTITNVGTDEDPIASVQVQLKWKIATVLKEINEKAIYYVQGDGLMQEIGSPFPKQPDQWDTTQVVSPTFENKINAENQERIEKVVEMLENAKF